MSIVHCVVTTPYLIYAHGGEVTRYNLDLVGKVDLVTGDGAITVCSFLYQDGVGYYADTQNRFIGRMNLDGSSAGKPPTIIIPTIGQVEGLAVNWINGALIWSDLTTRRMYSSRLDGSHVQVLINTGLVQPGAVALHPQTG